MGAPFGNKEGGEQNDEGGSGDPEGDGVESREGHAAGADLLGEDEAGESDLRRDGEHEEDHQRAVHGDEGQIIFRLEKAEEGKWRVGPDAMDAHDEREQSADGDGGEGKQEIEDSEGAVLSGEEAQLHRVGASAWACALERVASQMSNSAGETTESTACMRACPEPQTWLQRMG